ncbi:MAG: aldehyde dehydrogenase family protein, partial [Advenella sp.]
MDSVKELFSALGITQESVTGGSLPVHSPVDGARIADVREHTTQQTNQAIDQAAAAQKAWRNVPAPRRGELIRLLGEELREHKAALGRLVSVEAGKITAEGEGEVQEMIDICDFAVGLSRQLYGLTIASERPGHRMMETWHPVGVVGVITAFNFPVAVWSWNTALALVCGNAVIWKPSEKTPLTALATQALFERALKRFGDA